MKRLFKGICLGLALPWILGFGWKLVVLIFFKIDVPVIDLIYGGFEDPDTYWMFGAIQGLSLLFGILVGVGAFDDEKEKKN